MEKRRSFTKIFLGITMLGLMLAGSSTAFGRDKYETIEAQAFGTGTQMGQNIGVSLDIYEFSTPADRGAPGAGV